MKLEPKQFFLLKRETGKNVYVYQLPCLPRTFKESLGWVDGEVLKMKVVRGEIRIAPVGKLR